MRFGAVFPHLEIGNEPIVIRDFAQTVEAQGMHHLCIFDHILGAHASHFTKAKPPRYTDVASFHEVFALMGFPADATKRILLMRGNLVLPLRQTALVAKSPSTIDILSNGRLRMGVGVGWNFVEFEAM